MRKWFAIPAAVALIVQILPAQAAVKASTVAQVGDQCLREGKVAPGRAIDGTDLVCMKATLGSSKGELLWWYSKLSPYKILEIIAPIVSRSSDSPEVIASRTADRIGNSIGLALKSEELTKEYSAKNFTGGAGTWALSTFQAYKNRLATSFIGSQTLVNNLITSKSNLKLSDSKAIAQLVMEYESIAVPINSKYMTLDQLINELRVNPKVVSFVGGSLGGVDHVFMAKIFNSLDLDPKLGNYIPQNSAFDVVTKSLTDKGYVALSSNADFIPQVAAEKMRILGVASPVKLSWTTAKTLQQQGLNIVYGNWYGIFAPPQLSDVETSNLIHILDVLQNSKMWAKTLSVNYWSPAYVSRKDFEAQIDLQTGETKAILQQLGF